VSVQPLNARSSEAAAATAILAEARRVIALEAQAVAELEKRLDASFVAAVEAILATRGRVIVSAVGKSGIIARKIAATLTSTGTPAIFLHPVEALHGDLGIVGRDDIALLLSRSGESEELRGLLEYFSRTGVQVVAMTGRRDSSLARQADIVIDLGGGEEACPHGLAPTTSTTTSMVLGDALALALLEQRGFGREDFARIHPAGALGRKLLVRVRDVMIAGDEVPTMPADGTMRECVVLLAERRGTVAVVEPDGRLTGVVTAGDLTRLMEHNDDFFDVRVSEVMTTEPRTASPEDLGAAAVGLMERAGVMALPVVTENGRIAGMVHLHDLMRAGAV
jgi:arabinose-5-phosphate isomerase